MSGDCSIFTPMTTSCSYGSCVPATNFTPAFCVCQPGFSSFGDFSIFASNPCDMNLLAIRILWALASVGCLISYGAAVWGIVSRKQSGKLEWKAWRLWSIPYLVIVQSSIVLAIAIGKFISPDTWIVGASYPMTILHGVAILVCLSYLVIGLTGVSRAAYTDNMRGKSATDRLELKLRLRRLESGIALFWLAAAFASFVPCAAIVNSSNIWWAAGVQGCGLAAVMFILGSLVAPRQFEMVLEKVSESVKANENKTTTPNHKMRTVRFKLRVAKQAAASGFAFSAVCVTVIAVWPYLVIKTGYSLPVVYFIIQIVGSLFIWITTTTNSMQLRRPSIFSKRLSGRKSADRRTSQSPSLSGGNALNAALIPIQPPPANIDL